MTLILKSRKPTGFWDDKYIKLVSEGQVPKVQ